MKKGKHFKRLWSLMLLLIAMLMPQGAWAISGNGTASSPYLIANEADLRTFQQYVENGNSGIYGKLTADITLTSAWTRIGRADRRFTGYFDGQGHTISGMNLSFTAYEHGFFGFVNNATIKNFTLTGTMTSSANGNHSHGTVVGSAAGTTVIENVTSSVNLTLNHTGFTCIGGIVGHMADNTRVTGCTYTGTINLTKDSEQVGGIVGYAQNDLYITDNVFSGTITSTGTCKYLAGIAGKTDGTIEVSGCTNIGTINGGPSYDCVAGIVGYVQYQSRALITNCYFGGSLSSTSSGTSLGMGGILGAVNDDAGTNFRGLTYCFSDGTLTATNSSSTQIGGIAGVIKSKAVSKVMNNTYLSGTASRLAAISNNSSSFDSSNKAITISVTAGTGGTVEKSYVYPTSTTPTQLKVEATPNSGYHYVKWSDNGAQTHNVSLANNVSLAATFGAHTYGNWQTDKDATCTSDGTKHRLCATCGAREDVTIAALGHSYTSQTATDTYLKSAATCTADAVYYHKCSRCDSKGSTTWTKTGTALGHSYGAGSWSWADDGHSATCTRTCSNDPNHKSSASVTLGNGITSAQQVAPKCSTQGTTRYTATATVENVEYTSTKDVKDIAATGLHAFDDETDPYHTLCTVCDHSFFRYTATAKVEPNSPGQLMNSRNQGIYTTAKHTFADGQGIIEFNEPLVTIGTNAFYLRSALTGNLVIPNSVKSIGQQAFRSCSFSGNLILPNSLTQIGNDAFLQSGFTGDLTIPNSVTSIGEYAFSGCKGFTGDLTIPNSVTSIGAYAFSGCKGLDGNLTIGYSVTSIGIKTFSGCSELSGVEMKSIPYIHINAFSDVNCTKAVVLSDDSYVYKESNPYFPEVASVTAPCTLDLTGSVVENHANLTRTHECTVKSETETYLASAAGCENDATYFYKCANCDEHGTETWTKAGTAIGHEYSQVVDANYLVSAATCTNDAVYHEKCSRCTTHGAEWSATGTASGNHSYTNNTLTASPIEDGLYAYACDYGCGTHTDDHIIKDFNGAGNHLELTKDGEGNYSTSEDIILADANGFVSPVDFSAPSVTYTRTGIKNQFGTLVLPFDVNGMGADYDLYKLDQVFDYELVLRKVDKGDNGGIVPAGTPVLIRLHDDLDGNYDLTLTAASNAVSCQLAEGSKADGYQLVGTYETKELSADDYFISNNKFWSVGEMVYNGAIGVKTAPFRAYLKSTWAGVKARRNAPASPTELKRLDADGNGVIETADIDLMVASILNGENDYSIGDVVRAIDNAGTSVATSVATEMLEKGVKGDPDEPERDEYGWITIE